MPAEKYYQHTIKEEVSISGKGIHTGGFATMTIKPADPNKGIQFKRTDLPDQPIIKAIVDNVVDTTRSTTIGNGTASISTIEHLMAALVGLEIDNVLIEIDGGEVPILDGSSEQYIQLINSVGTQQQDAEKVFFQFQHNISIEDEEKDAEMVALPYDGYRINTLIDFNSKVLGTQHAELKSIKDFQKEIAGSRTFCFFHELETLLNHNLIKGGDMNNAIVVVEREITDEQINKVAKIFHKEDIKVEKNGYLNNLKLRYTNEPARHKLLDVMGDLALVGYPFKAHIIANKPGHATNVKFAKKLREHIKKHRFKENVPYYDPTVEPIMDIIQIKESLPHRFPFLLVDKVIELSDTKVVAIKNVTNDEPFFTGHFPNAPIMPGVLIVEALAQAGGLLAIPRNTPDKYDTLFLKIDQCKFKKMVVPGDTLVLQMELLHPIRRGLCEMKGTAFVANNLVAEGVLTAQIIKRTTTE